MLSCVIGYSSIGERLPRVATIQTGEHGGGQEEACVEMQWLVWVDNERNHVSAPEVAALRPGRSMIQRGPELLPVCSIQETACRIDDQARERGRRFCQLRHLRHLRASLLPAVNSLIGGAEDQARTACGCHDAEYIACYTGDRVPVSAIISALKKPLIATKQQMTAGQQGRSAAWEPAWTKVCRW